MDTLDLELLAFLKQQLEWHQQQDQILAEIEQKLYELRQITVFRLQSDVPFLQMQQLKSKVEQLKLEVLDLEQRLDNGMIH